MHDVENGSDHGRCRVVQHHQTKLSIPLISHLRRNHDRGSKVNILTMDPPKTTTAVQHLQLDQQATLGSLADDEVLVELHAASLSYRDIVIAKVSHNCFCLSKDHTDNSQGALGELPKVVIPGSDGAGVVKAVGSKVQDLAIGERVVTHLAPTEDDDALPPSMAEISTGLGHGQNGTLREYGIFKPTALVKAPHNLDFARAATLTCSGLTAWNALFGLAGREVKKGD